MSDARLSRLAWVVAGTGLAMMAAAMLLAVRRAPLGPVESQPTWYGDLIFMAALSVSLVVGGFVASRLPRNPYGWLLMAFGLGIGSIQGLAQNLGVYSYLIAPQPLPLSSLTHVLAGIGFSLTLAVIPLLFLLFPTGRLPSRRWRFFVAAIVLAFAALVVFLWLSPAAVFLPVPSPYIRETPLAAAAEAVASTAVVFMLFAILVSAVSVLVRGLRARGVERQQFKWLGLASALIVLAFFFNSELVPLLPGVLDILMEAVAFAAVPLAVGIAVLRYRLWDIDLVIRRTASYAILTGILALIYFSSIIAMQRLLAPLTGESNLATILSTLLIAALFLPLRRRVQNAIDRRFYRRKYNAEQVLAQFAATARDETDLDRLTAELLRVIQETMQPEHVSLWLRDTKYEMRDATSEQTHGT
jgi:hypothetical protein